MFLVEHFTKTKDNTGRNLKKLSLYIHHLKFTGLGNHSRVQSLFLDFFVFSNLIFQKGCPIVRKKFVH